MPYHTAGWPCQPRCRVRSSSMFEAALAGLPNDQKSFAIIVCDCSKVTPSPMIMPLHIRFG